MTGTRVWKSSVHELLQPLNPHVCPHRPHSEPRVPGLQWSSSRSGMRRLDKSSSAHQCCCAVLSFFGLTHPWHSLQHRLLLLANLGTMQAGMRTYIVHSEDTVRELCRCLHTLGNVLARVQTLNYFCTILNFHHGLDDTFLHFDFRKVSFLPGLLISSFHWIEWYALHLYCAKNLAHTRAGGSWLLLPGTNFLPVPLSYNPTSLHLIHLNEYFK